MPRGIRVVVAGVFALVAGGLALLGAAAHADTYPSKSITIVVPFGAGSGTDGITRIIAPPLSAALKQSVVIENKPGANGAIAATQVARAAPDGYTLLMSTNSPHSAAPSLNKFINYDPVKDFTPVSRVGSFTFMVAVHRDVPVTSVKELIAYAKANPGRLSYASAGVGNQTQLAAELLLARAGIKAVHVPYKSGAEMVTAILGEQVQMSFPDVSILLPLIAEKKVKALAVTSAKRHPQLPDVPTMAESGIADYVTTFWTGVIVPTGTPPDIVNKLNGAINDGLKSQLVHDSLGKVGAQPAPGSPQDFANFIASETRKWAAIAQTAGLEPQ